jgi:hypothetical protein
MNKTLTTFVIVVVALLLGAYGGYAYEKAKLLTMMDTQRMDMQKQIDDAKMVQENSMNDDKMISPTEMMMHTTVTPTDTMMKK